MRTGESRWRGGVLSHPSRNCVAAPQMRPWQAPMPQRVRSLASTQPLQACTAPQGTWTVVQDGSAAGTAWGTITWNTEPQGSVPPGTSLTVEARAADTEAGLGGQAFVAVTNGAAFNLTGRFIQVQVTFKPTTGRIVGSFKQNTPAAVLNELGRGKTVYVGACPGLSYLKDAGFVPTQLKEQYPLVQRRILTGLAAARGVPRLVELSQPVVEAGIYDAPAGTALVLANFTYRPIETLNVRVPLPKAVQTVRSVERGPLAFTEEAASPALRGQGYGSVASFTTRLDLADLILLE